MILSEQLLWYQNLFILGSAIATFVVTATAAGFVLPQLRALKRAAQSQTYQNLIANEVAVSRAFIDHPELHEHFYRDREWCKVNARAYYLATMHLDFWENLFMQRELGTLPGKTWEAWRNYVRDEFEVSILPDVWKEERGSYSPDFQKLIDDIVNELAKGRANKGE